MQASANGSENARPPQQQQPQPHWVAAVPYPAATMVLQRQMMTAGAPLPPQYAPHYVPYHHQQQPAQQPQQGSGEENRTVWVGDLQFWMDENYLQHCFGYTGEVVLIKVIRNRQTGQSEGYGFVEFCSHAAAENILQTFNGMIMPTTDQPFRINWATFSMGDRRPDAVSDHSIFVGDLAADVTDNLLQETFASRYTSVKGAKVIVDANTGRSKGYGFVRFGDENEKSRAMSEMNGVYCSSRAMRIGAATPRKSSGVAPNGSQGFLTDGDSSNTTVFVGGLDPNVSEEDLWQAFSQCGDIASVKIPVGKQCGFVHFVHRSNAEEALQRLNGIMIGKQVVRLSWGRSPMNKQLRADPASQQSNVYYGGQIYNGYGYIAPPSNPSMYATMYGPYSLYGNQQQVR